jgi:hypothetical protein
MPAAVQVGKRWLAKELGTLVHAVDSSERDSGLTITTIGERWINLGLSG